MIGDNLLQNINALIQGFIETPFFKVNHAVDVFLFILQLRVANLHPADDNIDNTVQELAFNTQQTAMPGRPSQEPSQHITSALVAG